MSASVYGSMNVMCESSINVIYCIFIMKSPINNLTSSSNF
jgi:hypothetical protein